jgi:hypothetical protein
MRALPFVALACAAVAIWGACSLQNVEGPDVTCADLACGRVNACKAGIIAQCLDGQQVRYHVCTSDAEDVCTEDWQLEGQYRCLEHATDCEGCRPERVQGCASSAGGAAP